MARRYARDNRGRFAPKGGGATARGGRLKTAGGAKRQTQTMKAAGGRAGTIGKPKGAKPAAKPVAGRFVPTTNSKGEVTGFRDRTKPAPSAAAVAQAARAQRAGRNLNAAMAREGDGPNSKASRSASVAKRARDIYSGKVDPKAKTKARLTRSTDQEALRKRIKKQKDNTTAAKPAAKPVAKSRSRRSAINDDKVSRVISRVNAVARNDQGRTGVKALNAAQVAVRAKSFLARKEGGNVGMLNQMSQADAFASVRKAMTKPPRYSTQKPNRNKPDRFNALGQDKARAKARLEARSLQEKIRDANATAKAKADKSKPSRLAGRRELYSSRLTAPPDVKGPRIKGTIAKPKQKPKLSTSVIRTRTQSRAAQRSRRNTILDRARPWYGRNPGIKRSDTGMRQLSLAGPSKTLYSFKRTKLGRKPR